MHGYLDNPVWFEAVYPCIFLSLSGCSSHYHAVKVSRMPIVGSDPVAQSNSASLLNNRKCVVHKREVYGLCNFPTGRCLVARNPKEGLKDISKAEIQYIFMNPRCADMSGVHIVWNIWSCYGITIEDRFLMKW